MNESSNSAVIGARQTRATVVTTTKQVEPTETFLETDSTGGAFTVTMPHSLECPAGQTYLIRHIVDGGDVTIAFKSTDRGPSGLVMTAVNGYVSLVAGHGQWTVSDSKLS